MSVTQTTSRRNNHRSREIFAEAEKVLVGGVNKIAHVDLPNADASIDRRFDMTVIEIHLRSVSGGLRFLRVRDGSVVILRRYDISRAQVRLPLQRDLIQGRLRFRLIEDGLVRMRIELSEDVAGFYILSFGKKNFHQFAIDARMHGHGVERLDGPEAVEINRHIFLFDLGRDNRYRAAA